MDDKSGVNRPGALMDDKSGVNRPGALMDDKSGVNRPGALMDEKSGRNQLLRKWIHILGSCLFLLYMAGLVYFLFLSEGFGHGGVGEYDINVYPFREIRRYIQYRDVLGTRAVLTNLVGNVIGFLPFGALVPLMFRGARKFWRTALLSFEISALVEVTQLIFHVGCFDVDDMILNTLGGALGYLGFALLGWLYLKVESRAN